jgi:hypothetical protein
MRAANNQRIAVPDLAERIADCLATLEATARASTIPITGDGRVSEPAAAELVGLAAGTLRNLRAGSCPLAFYKVAGRVTYRLADLAEFIERQRADV